MKIKAYCEGCSEQLRGRGGVVHIELSAVHERSRERMRIEKELAAFEEALRERSTARGFGSLGVMMSGADLLDRAAIEDQTPPRVRWKVHCDACNPHPTDTDAAGRTVEWCGGCYWWTVDRSADWRGLMDWRRHLDDKGWLRDTDWDVLIEQLDDAGRSRLRFGGRRNG